MVNRPRHHNHRDLYVLPSSLLVVEDTYTTQAKARRVVIVEAVRKSWPTKDMLNVLDMLGLIPAPPVAKRSAADTSTRA